MQNWQVNRFTDIGDLCRAIRASCHIPSPRRRSVRFRGQACIDGGFSSNTPIVGERCLCVSPFRFSRQADIRPSDKVNPMRALLVPSRMQADDLFRRGRDDGKRFLQALADGAVHVKASAARRNVAKRVAPFLPRVP
jgi:predicted patatin/cPLA2 family phospholipase